MCRLLWIWVINDALMLWLPWLSWLRAISQKHGGSEIEDCTVFCWLDFRDSGGARDKCLQDQSETTDPPPKHLTMLSNAGPTWRPGRWCSRSSWCVQPWESRWWWYPATWTSWVVSHNKTWTPCGCSLWCRTVLHAHVFLDLGLLQELSHVAAEVCRFGWHFNPPRQMLARIEFKLEEYLAYLDEASWIRWNRLILSFLSI